VLAVPGCVDAFAGATLLMQLDTDAAVPGVAGCWSRGVPT
jgi:hypothetical protein